MVLTAIHIFLVALYLVTLGILTIYGFHRYLQVYLYWKHLHNKPQPAGTFPDLPKVTVQLPMYNEMYVARRIIEGTCALDYPRDKLQIQVLDDSTDGSADIARECSEEMRRLGHNVQYIHRTNRQGYKAGALTHGLQSATGEFVAVFDADFVPNPEMLKKTIHYFTDPNVGCVQTRWDHINRTQSLLTRSQAIFLDGHFMIEHVARNRSGRFINFNGTAGIWRKKAIDDSGGWQHDTLTEDVDLSYRAQIRGWQFVFLPEILAPAELPPEISGFKQQQHRWTKGQVQTAVKLLPLILKAPIPLKVKLEAFMHLTNPAVYLPAIILSVILFPVWYVDPELFTISKSAFIAVCVASFCGLLTASAGTFYMLSQQAVGRSQWRTALLVPFLMALGMGISLMNGLAVLEGLFGRKDTEFVRTPKYGTGGAPKDWKKKSAAFNKKKLSILPFIEITFGLYLAACTIIAVLSPQNAWGTVPFLVIFSFGYFYVGFLTIHGRWVAARVQKEAASPVPASAEALAA